MATAPNWSNLTSDPASVLAEARAWLEAGGDPNQPGPDGRTPLHLAAAQGHLGLAQLLLRHGATPHPKDEAGDTPMALAEAGQHLPVYRLLQGWE